MNSFAFCAAKCLGLLFVLVTMLSGCATITKGSTQNVTVETDPAGAVCTLTREGQTVAVVNPTPGTALIGKDKDPIAYVCTLDEYQDASGTLESEFEAVTLGNILLGGFVGIAIDAGSGAMNEYPANVRIVLTPSVFPNQLARDVFYDKRRSETTQNFASVREKATEACGAEDCTEKLKKLNDAEAVQLNAIEQQRAAARVSS
ncbi:MAG: hypothetical protein K0U93_23950 [Gammaproteobacteria bacterium]|nr:hypothetical protein [Gammaproteobacteria bacterium]